MEGAVPAGVMSVTFRITDNNGTVIRPEATDRLAINVAGPTTDYTNRWTETVDTALTVDAGDGAFRNDISNS